MTHPEALVFSFTAAFTIVLLITWPFLVTRRAASRRPKPVTDTADTVRMLRDAEPDTRGELTLVEPTEDGALTVVDK